MLPLPKLPKGISAVQNPDHPFTFDGPDYLLYGHKGLLAVFEIRQNEMINAPRLFARLTNALLAYPATTQMILTVDNNLETSSAIIQLGPFYFDRMVDKNDLKRSGALLKDKKPVQHLKDIKSTQRKLFNLQAQVQNDNINYIKRKKDFQKRIVTQSPLKNKAKYINPVNKKETVVRAQIFEYEQRYFGQKKLLNHISDLKDLQPFYEFSIFSEFQVDNGVPYFKYLSRKVLNVDDIPTVRFDPLKPTRVASLFGWHLVNTDDFTEMEQRIAKYKK